MKRSFSQWLVLLVLIGALVGMAGGGIIGGLVSYYFTLQSRTNSAVPLVTRVVQPSTVSALSVIDDSTITNIVKQAEPAVVTILNTMQVQNGHQGSGTALASGSGVFIDAQGHIVTNAHVVQNARQLQIIYNDGTQATATLVGADTANDIAVLKVNGKVPGYLAFGDSNGAQLGETVVAIGSPLGDYRGTVTLGVVSGLNRTVDGSGLSNLIQTDAAINNGNSGGPLLDLNGQILGINTLVVRDASNGSQAQGLGFAIPASTVSQIVQRLIARGG